MDSWDFVKLLSEKGHLKTISAPVDSFLEIAEITRRVHKSQNYALLFSHVINSQTSIATNLFGSGDRIRLALEGSHNNTESKFKDVDNDFLLDSVIKSWELEEGFFHTFATTVTNNSENDEINMGIYRIRVFDNRTISLSPHENSSLMNAINQAKKMGKKSIKAAILFGAQPPISVISALKMPKSRTKADLLKEICHDLQYFEYAGLKIPKGASRTLAGEIFIDKELKHGKTGNFTGLYAEASFCPVFKIDKIFSNNKEPIVYQSITDTTKSESRTLYEFSSKLFTDSCINTELYSNFSMQNNNMPKMESSSEVSALVTKRWKEYGF